nr:hypothetical protein [uncultured Albidiferax sp.]
MGAAAKTPTTTTRPLAAVLVERLVAAGTWVNRPTLVRGLSTSTVALEDALADLVVGGKAEWRDGSGYRLVGGQLARQAAQKRQAVDGYLHVLGKDGPSVYRVGVAERFEGLGVVMYELELPLPAPGPNFMKQYQRIVESILPFSHEARALEAINRVANMGSV